MANTTTQAARLVRERPCLGTIINDKVGSIQVDGEDVADFCEVDPGWFYTEDYSGNVFTGSEAEVLSHYQDA